ncbi:MAG: T9SS type A sorting domain-containing protein [Bacteroidales bacterium]|nr:T9SS type A sorting domain-containing protein [Bacteroidales bacterium]
MKTRYILLAVILILSGFNLSAQNTKFKYAKTGSSESIEFAFTDTIGNSYFIGSFYDTMRYLNQIIVGTPGQEGGGIFVLKTRPNGDLVYLHPIIGLQEGSYFNLQQAAFNQKGELVVSFNTPYIPEIQIASRIITGLKADGQNQVVAKFSKNGFLMWVNTINPAGDYSNVTIESLILDEAGALALGGNFAGEKLTFADTTIVGLKTEQLMFLAKYSPDGNEEWLNSCKPVFEKDTVGSIQLKAMKTGSGGSIFAMGTVSGTNKYWFGDSVVYNTGVQNAFFARFNSKGYADWANRCTGDGTIIPESMTIDHDGAPVFSVLFQSTALGLNGSTFSSVGSYDLLLSNYNADMQSIWDQNLNTNLPYVSDYENEATLMTNDSSDILLMGKYFSTYLGFYAFQIDKNVYSFKSTPLLSAENLSDIYFKDAIQDRYGNIYFYGNTYSGFSFGEWPVEQLTGLQIDFFGRISNTGVVDFIFSHEDEDLNNIDIYSLGVDNFSNVFISGHFYGENASLGGVNLGEVITDGNFYVKYGSVSQVSGTVIDDDGFTIAGGYVKLLGYAMYQNCIIADSVKIRDDGRFLFSDVPYGIYILHAFPEENDGKQFAPVYFPAMAHWEEAARIEVKEATVANLYIFARELPQNTGNCILEGFVNELDEEDVFKSTENKPRPQSKATLVTGKKKSEYDIVAITETDDNGMFSFYNIEDGDYLIIIEEPGLPQTSTHEVTISGNNYISSINYLMGEETIEAIGEPQISKVDNPQELRKSIHIYPNPSTDGHVFLDLPSEGLSHIIVTRLDGRVVYNAAILNTNLHLTLDPGIFIITLTNADVSETIKVSVIQ